MVHDTTSKGEAMTQPKDSTGSPNANIAIVVCREDSRHDVDETYGTGTYDRFFPKTECPHCGEEYFTEDLHICPDDQDGVVIL